MEKSQEAASSASKASVLSGSKGHTAYEESPGKESPRTRARCDPLGSLMCGSLGLLLGDEQTQV